MLQIKIHIILIFSVKGMGRTRGGRRHVLQLNDNQESYLGKFEC